MSALQLRCRAVIERDGDVFIAGGSSRKGRFSLLPSDQAEALFTATELDALPRPLFRLYVAHDDPAAESDLVDWRGETFLVRRVLPLRHRDETIGRMLVIG